MNATVTFTLTVAELRMLARLVALATTAHEGRKMIAEYEGSLSSADLKADRTRVNNSEQEFREAIAELSETGREAVKAVILANGLSHFRGLD